MTPPIRTRALALLIALPVTLGGCGVAQDLAGVRPAPAESTDGASLSVEAAQQVATRVIGEARSARSASGSKGTAAREAVLSGPALREADAAAKAKTPTKGETPEIEVLAVDRDPQWPRTILATGRQGSIQRLYVLVSTKAQESYRLFADVPMAAGASVPAIGPIPEGAEVSISQAPEGPVRQAVEAWTTAVSYPAPKKAPKGISLRDSFSMALKGRAKDQVKDLNKLATYTEKGKVTEDGVATIALGDGSTLAFVPLTRTQTITGNKKLQKLSVEEKPVERLSGKDAVRSTLEVSYAETVAMVIPAKGEARVVGLEQQVATAKGK